ncbi:MAG: SLBB domain-containing protein [Candidatus Binataceae bacterium]
MNTIDGKRILHGKRLLIVIATVLLMATVAFAQDQNQDQGGLGQPSPSPSMSTQPLGQLGGQQPAQQGLQPSNAPGFGGGSDATTGLGSGTSLNAAGTASGLGSPADAAAVASKLGLSPAELAGLKNQYSSGSLSPDELQQLCLRFAAKQLSPDDTVSIARSLGLSLTPGQIAQLKSCTQLSGPGASPSPETRSETAGQRVYPGQNGAEVRPSSIERAFHALDSGAAPRTPTSLELTQFGYSLFDSRVSTFAPVENVPVGNDYIIGPGDEINVLIWGRINDKLDLTVQRDGSVLIPQIGPLQVAGLTFQQARKLIEDRGEQITGVKVDVTMGRLRTIQVFVIGEVQQPGAYTVSALSRVSNALAASGGINKVGSLRRIEIRRGDRTIKNVDLYRMLLRGDTSADVRLEPGDVIFVPVIGPVTGIAGDVKRPAIYELNRNGETLQDVLKLAGGISAFGYSQRVQVERVQAHERRIALDVDLNDVRSHHFMVEDGDLVKIYPVLPEQKDVVMVRGNVNRPGSYQWYPGMRVADLVRAAEGVAPRTFFRYALVKRLAGAEKAIRLVPVDLGDALAENLNSPADLQLNSQDTLTVFNEDQIKDLPTVQVFGEVRNPGFYVLDRGMRVSDLIYLAGGLKDDAYQAKAELARTQVVNGARTSHTYEDLNLRLALAGGDASNPELKPNDQLFVRTATDWHLPWVVQVKGQVLRPGPYTIHEGERLASLLERSGGLLPDAYPPGAIFIRQSIKEVEKTRLDQARQQLQDALARYELKPASLGEDKSTAMDPKSAGMLQKMLERNQDMQAQGRLVIHLRALDQLAQSPDNIVLEDQDTLEVPRRPASVNVLGQVYSPNAIVYQADLTVRDYLERAGGPSEGADTDHIFVVRADGAIMTEAGIKNSSRGFMFPLLPRISGGLMSRHLEPGDTVFVPQKLIYKDNVKLYSNVAQIVASTAQSLAIFALAAGL